MSAPRLEVGNDALQRLKLAAVGIMCADHINKYLFNQASDFVFALGRMAMPIFCFVLAVNLARSDNLKRAVYSRTAFRLAVFGLLATPPFLLMGGPHGHIYPLNAMFTLLVLSCVTYLLDSGRRAHALFVFIAGGALVEFWWPAIAFGAAVWIYARAPSWSAGLVAVIACTSFSLVNGNQWALLALPTIFALASLPLAVPRWQWFFYGFYPAHLIALLIIRIPMSRAGYLFF